MGNEEMEKRIFEGYKWGLRIVPAVLMAAHWWLTLRFHGNDWSISIEAEGNVMCVKALYVMAYVFPLLAMLPASYFYRLGRVWRIPFWYLAGVIAVRMWYGSWVITDAMEWADKALIAAAVMAYAHWAAQRVRAAQ